MRIECNLYVRPDLLEVGPARRQREFKAPVRHAAKFEQVDLPGQVSAKFWHLVDVLELVVAQPS